MQFSDPYEEWKANGRQGGTYKPPTSTPPAPAPPAPAPGPTPQTTPNAPPPAAPRPGAPPPSTIQLGNTGQTIDQRFAQQRAGDASGTDAYRDTAYSPDQWGAWEQEERQKVAAGTSANQNGQCPPDKPFSSRPGPNGKSECAFKPDDCPEGSHVVGTPGTCVPNGPDGGGGGGGGVGGSGGGAGGAGGAGGGFDEMNQWWMNKIKDQGTRYSPEAMAALEADQFSRARAQEKTQLQQARADMAQRGVRGSASQNAAVRQIGVGTGQQIMQNRAQIQKAKIDADYQDKQAAIKNAMDYVNSMRDYLLRSDTNAIQREQIQAQIRLATQNIQAQKDLTEQNYQNNLSTGFLFGQAG